MPSVARRRRIGRADEFVLHPCSKFVCRCAEPFFWNRASLRIRDPNRSNRHRVQADPCNRRTLPTPNPHRPANRKRETREATALCPSLCRVDGCTPSLPVQRHSKPNRPQPLPCAARIWTGFVRSPHANPASRLLRRRSTEETICRESACESSPPSWRILPTYFGRTPSMPDRTSQVESCSSHAAKRAPSCTANTRIFRDSDRAKMHRKAYLRQYETIS